jgi:hypothetical protein
MERGLGRFTDEQIKDRWPEVFNWIADVIAAWVQRYKHLKIERGERGVTIAMETQDDRGYYHYEFDVLPYRARRKGRS